MTALAMLPLYPLAGILLACLRLSRSRAFTPEEAIATLVLYAIVWPVFLPLVFWRK